MKVRDVMTSAKLLIARPGDDLALAAQMMVWGNARHLPVVRNGLVVGVVSQRDLLARGRLKGGDEVTIENVMHSPAITVEAEAPLASAVSLMFGHKLGCLPVLAEGALVGILTTTDLLRHELETGPARQAEQLPKTVRALMKPVPVGTTRDPLFDSAALIVRADAPVANAVAELLTQNVGLLPVMADDGTIVGTLSYRDLIRALPG